MLSKVMESFQEFVSTFPREGENGWDVILAKTGLHGLLGGRDYRALDRVVSFIAEFINQNTEHERTAPALRRYSELLADVRGDMGQKHRVRKS